jgi:hypothetical protein
MEVAGVFWVVVCTEQRRVSLEVRILLVQKLEK